MIIRLHRFHGYNSLCNVYSRGRTVRGGYGLIALKYIQNPRRDSYRAAVVVSRKVHKSAVVRNRIRRRIYEVIRTLENRMQQPHDMVVTVFSEQIANMESAALRKMLEDQLATAGIVTPSRPVVGKPPAPHAIVEHIERVKTSEAKERL